MGRTPSNADTPYTSVGLYRGTPRDATSVFPKPASQPAPLKALRSCPAVMIAYVRPKMMEHSMADLPQIYLTQNDLDRLLALVESQPGKRLEKLESELLRAHVVP